MGPYTLTRNTGVVRLKLFVQGLPDGCDKASLKALFAKYGEGAECDIVKNKFAFVYMADHREGYAAMKALDNYEFMGRKLYVRLKEEGITPQCYFGKAADPIFFFEKIFQPYFTLIKKKKSLKKTRHNIASGELVRETGIGANGTRGYCTRGK
ncbi:hypothetical protein HPB48_021557 [Haemaphysalis longicornis]|uniref:RRM domain-containing protein n=1 Tax=Haemaphysalis longicornis TaxID=44386 RepID=A0A9J6H2E3_HAELO|nr:hypothetical protein HPB48_021557 [Haemaphysalis longicornis]